MIAIDIFDEQSYVSCDQQQLCRAVGLILEDASVRRATISLALVDDETIRRLHGRYLGRDEPTDVLSFPLETGPQGLEAELVVSAERAAAMGPQFGWTAEEELLLYVVHGMLHLVGYDDRTAAQQAEMRRREEVYLRQLGRQHDGDF